MTDTIRQTPANPPKRRGCFFYGCMTCVVLLLIGATLVFFTARWVRGKVFAYTDAAPMELPRVEMPEPELTALQERLKLFGDGLNEGKPVAPLILTEREINALFAESPDMKYWADKVYFSLEGDAVKGQVSVPLTRVPLVRERYFNGTATFKVVLTNGNLSVNLDAAEVKGKPVPEAVMAEVRKENFAKDIASEPKNAEAISKFESIGIEDSKVTIKARARE